MIDLETLAKAVRDMRRVQTLYYHTRDTCHLVGARQREIAVDKLVREALEGCDLFEHAAAEARACAGERTPSATRDDEEGGLG